MDPQSSPAADVNTWLEQVWNRTHTARIVAGGEFDGPLTGRPVLAEAPVGDLRRLTTTGRFTGDICRCPGGPTIVLRDAAGRILAGASVHHFGSVSWERDRFFNDLAVADPVGLHLLLIELGVPGQLASFLAPLAGLLDLNEGTPQYRPAGEVGLRVLAERDAPEVLRPALAAMTGHQAGGLPDARIDDLGRLLTVAIPDPGARAAALLSWLGHLTVPAEALWGEGVLARRLLAALPTSAIATAARATSTGHLAMGLTNLLLHSPDDGTLAPAVAPALRALFTTTPAPGVSWRDTPEELGRLLRKHGQNSDRVDDVQSAWEAFREFLSLPVEGLEAGADGFIVQWGRNSWNDGLPALSFTRQFAVHVRHTEADPGACQPEHWQVHLVLVFPETPALAGLDELPVQDTGFDFSAPGPERERAIGEAEWELRHYPTLRALWASTPTRSGVELFRAD